MKVEIGNATLYLGDCRDILPTLPKVDAIVSDPPYGIGIAANPVRQSHARLDWDQAPPEPELIEQMVQIAQHSILWGGNYFKLPPSQCFLVWDKQQPQNFSLAMCEQAWTNLKKPAKLFRQSVLSYKKDHPTQKPIELMEWCIDQLPDTALSIVDPFMGSGTTGIAALRKGRKFIGIEREPSYFEVACERIRTATMQASLFAPELPPAPTAFEQTGLFGSV